MQLAACGAAAGMRVFNWMTFDVYTTINVRLANDRLLK
jgi:hypothetical protein